MKSIASIACLFALVSCKTTSSKSESQFLERGGDGSSKRIALFNPPPESGLKSDFTQDSYGMYLNRLEEQKYYKTGVNPIPYRDWNIMSYDCNRFANDAVKHLKNNFYVWMFAYTHSPIEDYASWDMDNLTAEQLATLQRKIPNPKLSGMDGSIINLKTWKDKYSRVVKQTKDLDMHAGLVIKMRKWETTVNGGNMRTRDVYAFIEPQSGYYIVDWPVTDVVNGIYPKDPEVARTLVHHMDSQHGYYPIAGREGETPYDPSDYFKEDFYCAMRTKLAFDWKNPEYWVVYFNNTISKRSHCTGCCTNKADWASREYDTDGVDGNMDGVYMKWRQQCIRQCNLAFSK